MEETYVCKNCGYTTNNIESTGRYIYSHSKNGQFKLHPLCPVCGHAIKDVREKIVVI
ncbi:MAG TPA: hypothetical protein PK718_06265 [Candidatus Methanofastidiosa archaeon]|nr:hypothetical protein [Candidatus Methanofastidiosa archaeon]HPR42136.1 hypothetical protein [Candidatus Methanofastidiosa archaeon]